MCSWKRCRCDLRWTVPLMERLDLLKSVKPLKIFFPPCLPAPRPRPTAGRPRPLPRPPGRPLLHHRRQHAEPQAQIPPVQGDEEGPDNVSALPLFLLPPDPTCLSPLVLCFPSTLFLPPSSSRPTTSLPPPPVRRCWQWLCSMTFISQRCPCVHADLRPGKSCAVVDALWTRQPSVWRCQECEAETVKLNWKQWKPNTPEMTPLPRFFSNFHFSFSFPLGL